MRHIEEVDVAVETGLKTNKAGGAPHLGAALLKTDFLVTSAQTGAGPNVLLQTLKEHYKTLAATYRIEQMRFEADQFIEMAEELEQIEQRIKA